MIRRLKKLLGKYRHIQKEINYESRWFGTEYGGFYIIPELVGEHSVIYSFGIGEDISFDKELIKEFKCHVYGFDPTPKSINWCEEQTLPDNFKFFKYGLANKTGVVTFNLPKNENHVSGSIINHKNVSIEDSIDVDMKSFKDIIGIFKHKKIDVIKMDIEGSEYDTLESIFMSGIQINQIVVEFHERFFKDGKEKTIKALDLLKRNGFLLYAISDSYEELSFVNKEAFQEL
tara:strand:- start:6372 stop:7064 length:693 start_codon:yes stop_codon:yes gene_type:complete